jgi:hypothetical protein
MAWTDREAKATASRPIAGRGTEGQQDERRQIGAEEEDAASEDSHDR